MTVFTINPWVFYVLRKSWELVNMVFSSVTGRTNVILIYTSNSVTNLCNEAFT